NRSMLGVCAGSRPECIARSLSPEIDTAVGRVAVDLTELVLAQLEVVQRGDIRLQLLQAADPDERGADARVTQRPRERQLREGLPALLRDPVQRADLLQRLVRDELRRQ